MFRSSVPAAVWLALNGSDWSSWVIGAPACLLAALASQALGPKAAHLPKPSRIPGFFAYFVQASWHGGVDVAGRALARPDRLDARLARHHLRLPPGPARSSFCFAISVLPGTLVAAIGPDTLEVHCIGTRGAPEAALGELEDRVAHLFDLDLDQAGMPGDMA